MKVTNRNHKTPKNSQFSSSTSPSSNKNPFIPPSNSKKSSKKAWPIFLLIGLIALVYFFYTPNKLNSFLPPSLINTLATVSKAKSTTSSSENISLVSKSPSTVTNLDTSKDIVKIGLSFELSGDMAEYGIDECNGAKLAIGQFNARQDKPFIIEAIVTDNKGDSALTTSITSQLIEKDGVIGIIGTDPYVASEGEAYELASLNEVPIISPEDALISDLRQPNGEPYEYVWSTFPQDNWQGKALATYVYNDLNLRKIAILDEDNKYGYYGIRMTETFSEQFKALGGEILQYKYGESGLKELIEQINDKNVDAIYIGGYEDNIILQGINAIRNENLNIPILGTDWLGLKYEDFATEVGSNKLNNIYYASDFDYYFIDYSSSILENFEEEYKKEYGKDPGVYATLGYCSTNLLLFSLEQADHSGVALNEQIKRANLEDIIVSFNFDLQTHSNEEIMFSIETLVNGNKQKLKEISLK